jgi:hypothetical protein
VPFVLDIDCESKQTPNGAATRQVPCHQAGRGSLLPFAAIGSSNSALAERATARTSLLCSEVMATANKSNLFSKLFRVIGKPRASIAPLTMLAMGILMLGLVAGGFLLHSRLDKLETELPFAKGGVESTNERLMSLQREVSQIRQDQSSAAAMIARLDNRLSAMAQPTSPQNNVLQITAVEAKLIREFLIKIDALKPMVEAGHKVGDTLPEDRLLDFSAVLTQRVPKLKNINYTIDQSGSIILVSENRIVAILDFVNVAR